MNWFLKSMKAPGLKHLNSSERVDGKRGEALRAFKGQRGSGE